MSPSCQLFLARDAETAWTQCLRPWLEQPGALRRDYVVVPTRGQAHALKQRCLSEGVPLLGVEFLSPGLARKKWASPHAAAEPVLGRELLLLGLREALDQQMKGLSPDDERRGILKTLQSDPEHALDDFDELLKGGFTAADFPHPAVKALFETLTTWVRGLGYEFAQTQNERAALTAPAAEQTLAGDRLLIYGLTTESWGEFFNVAALARRARDLTVVLPEPEFGRKALDESWIKLWEVLLGVEPVAVAPAEPSNGAAVAALWTEPSTALSSDQTEVLLGLTRTDETQLVADKVVALLRAGADNIGIIFPGPDAAHQRLAARLAARGVPFADLIETPAAPAIEVRIQAALLDFYERGGRLEEFLEIWARLRPLDQVKASLGAARGWCERLFDEGQTHPLADYTARLETMEGEHPRALAALAKRLPPWPAEQSLADALTRFESLCADLLLALPPGWGALRKFSERETRSLPTSLLAAALKAFLPEASPAANALGKGVFAHVTLTTRRRAEGVSWSHLIFCEANAGVWPRRVESSPWLPDDVRTELTQKGRFSLGLFTADDRTALERAGYAALARNACEQVIFSAALFDEEEAEIRLGPNAWVERLLFAQKMSGPEVSLEAEWIGRARAVGAKPAAEDAEPRAWLEIWKRRRDPELPFDDYFYSVDPARVKPKRLPARLVERGYADPIELWYGTVLDLRRIEWQPLVRARKKALGQLAHRLLAEALRGPPAEGAFCSVPSAAEACIKLMTALTALRTRWPADRYWDSFYAELSRLAQALLDKVLPLTEGKFAVLEWSPPKALAVPVPGGGQISVYGRLDLALADRPAWAGAEVVVVDFKTGTDPELSVKKMAQGQSLQLGLYLAMARALGATTGAVWLLKPDAGAESALSMTDLDEALTPLMQIQHHLASGHYGQLTVDRTAYTYGYTAPLACTPIAQALLAKKFALTFPETIAPTQGGDP